MFEIQDTQIPQENPKPNGKVCQICSQEFTASKYRPSQSICSKPECQKERQRQNILSWRKRNPAYFRHIHANPHWRSKRSLRSRQWRLSHPDHIRQYREAHRDYYRIYMREYMRQYRKRRAGGAVTVDEGKGGLDGRK